MTPTLKIKPHTCARCGSDTIRRTIEYQLVEVICCCGYIAREREGGLRDATDFAENQPHFEIVRT